MFICFDNVALLKIFFVENYRKLLNYALRVNNNYTININCSHFDFFIYLTIQLNLKTQFEKKRMSLIDITYNNFR